MVLAEKIIKLRKKNGWSQEELAAKLGISRQSVSKWESAASIPDLDKIIKMSEIFAVSTDYLLKENVQEEMAVVPEPEERSRTGELYEDIMPERKVSMETAGKYMELVEHAAKRIAMGVAACIISPVLLILMGGMAEQKMMGITENMAGGMGVVILILIVACAVAVFVSLGIQLGKYEYMENEPISLEDGAAGIVEMKRESFEPVYKRYVVTGVVLCIISVVPMFIAAAFTAADIIYIYCVDFLLILIALGVYRFVWAGMIWGSYQKLLEEGDYTREKKLENKRNGSLSTIYWCTATAVYLGISFLTGRWDMTWIIWPCAGVLFAAVCAAAAIMRKKR